MTVHRSQSLQRLSSGALALLAGTVALCMMSVAASQSDGATTRGNAQPAMVQAGQSVRLSGTAGGDERATRFGVSSTGVCTGWIPQRAQHRIQLGAADSYRIAVRAPGDTTLIITDGDSLWCNDDSGQSVHPEVVAEIPAGRYDIYVGAWEAGDRIPYTLTIEAR